MPRGFYNQAKWSYSTGCNKRVRMLDPFISIGWYGKPYQPKQI